MTTFDENYMEYDDYVDYDNCNDCCFDKYYDVSEEKRNEIYTMLRNLLLNEFDNNLFFGINNNSYSFGIDSYNSDNKKIDIIGIKSLYYYNQLISKYNYGTNKTEKQWEKEIFLGIKNIYIIHNIGKKGKRENPRKKIIDDLKIPQYILDAGLPIKLIKCDLIQFLNIYPELIDNKFTEDNVYYSYANSLNGEIYAQSCKCEGLVGANILPQLIVGESFDFEHYESSSKYDSYDKKFNEYCNETINKLKLNGVNCIINVYKDHDKTYPQKSVKYLNDNCISVYSFPLDENTKNTSTNANNFYQAVDKVNEQINLGKKVYLHCYVGKNRSMSVALLYMVKYLKIPLKLACEEAYLKKTYATQIKFMIDVWNQAKTNGEECPIALCKIIGDASNIGNTYSSYGLGFYDVHKLDVIAGRKILPLVNDYKKIEQYINSSEQLNQSDKLDESNCLEQLNQSDKNNAKCLIC